MKKLILVLALVFIGCGNPNDSPPGTPAHCSQNFAQVTVFDDTSDGQQHIGCLRECPGVICWEVCEAIAKTRRDNIVWCPCDGTPCEDIL